jgi:hypothetical protein
MSTPHSLQEINLLTEMVNETAESTAMIDFLALLCIAVDQYQPTILPAYCLSLPQ